MALQWYRLDPMTGRLVWKESETRPGAGWEASDVPLFDSDQLDPETLWRGQGETATVREDHLVQLVNRTWSQYPGEGPSVRPDLPEGQLPAWEYRRAHPTEYQPPTPLRLVGTTPVEQQGPPPEYLREMREMIRRYYPGTAEVLDEMAPLTPAPPASLVPRPEDPGHSPRVRAWWKTVHRLSSARRGRPVLPWRSGPRVAGHRKQGWT
jgi:hypothetical protein